MMDVFEFSTRRLAQAGLNFPASVPNYEQEIKYIKLIDWSSANIRTYTQRDSDINVVRRILKCLYDNAPATISTQTIPSSINMWISQPPDLINIIESHADLKTDSISIKFDSKFEHSHLPSITLGWPLNALASASVYIERSGIILGDSDCKTHNLFVRKISDLTVGTGGPITQGDVLDLNIVFKSLNGQLSSKSISLTVT